MRAIRTRITLAATITVAVVLVAAAIGLLVSQRRMLTDRLDDALFAHAEEIAASVREGEFATPLPSAGDDESFALVVDSDGSLLATTIDARPSPAVPGVSGGGRQIVRTIHPFPGEAAYRVVTVRVGDPASAGGASGGPVVHVGEPLDDIDESQAALRTGLTVAIPTVAALLAALVWLLVGRTLRPVEDIRREVAGISGFDLARRVPEPATGDEIDRLARTMNAMLDRLEAASLRQKQFVADASHELRSPLARIRSELEVDLAHPETADPRMTHLSVLDDLQELQDLVDGLLTLARDDTRTVPPSTTVVDLDDIVMDEVRRCRAVYAGTVDVSGVSAAQVRGEAVQLARVVRNLLDNAARHASTRIEVTLVGGDTGTTLAISDDGDGIAVEHHQHVFERFTRLDEARARADGGAGLGLAICRAIVERHGGTIGVETGDQVGARLVVRLPPL